MLHILYILFVSINPFNLTSRNFSNIFTIEILKKFLINNSLIAGFYFYLKHFHKTQFKKLENHKNNKSIFIKNDFKDIYFYKNIYINIILIIFITFLIYDIKTGNSTQNFTKNIFKNYVKKPTNLKNSSTSEIYVDDNNSTQNFTKNIFKNYVKKPTNLKNSSTSEIYVDDNNSTQNFTKNIFENYVKKPTNLKNSSTSEIYVDDYKYDNIIYILYTFDPLVIGLFLYTKRNILINFIKIVFLLSRYIYLYKKHQNIIIHCHENDREYNKPKYLDIMFMVYITNTITLLIDIFMGYTSINQSLFVVLNSGIGIFFLSSLIKIKNKFIYPNNYFIISIIEILLFIFKTILLFFYYPFSVCIIFVHIDYILVSIILFEEFIRDQISTKTKTLKIIYILIFFPVLIISHYLRKVFLCINNTHILCNYILSKNKPF
ncbi:hypothetical protein AB836_00755 [Rickettsiales bacterium (ex Bugula neritina AB1)]|nr:hypothetical protein AB836_00755 [Rickettsiales bacterium (ex Bugula neritina AB1)]